MVVPREDKATRDVVIVEVGFRDVRDRHPRAASGRFDAVGIALGVDRERHRTVMNEVAAVPQLGRFDDDDVHAESLT
ncbi:hypothetical protein GCM10023063_05420 [Arthrobacter methylotrophus]